MQSADFWLHAKSKWTVTWSTWMLRCTGFVEDFGHHHTKDKLTGSQKAPICVTLPRMRIAQSNWVCKCHTTIDCHVHNWVEHKVMKSKSGRTAKNEWKKVGDQEIELKMTATHHLSWLAIDAIVWKENKLLLLSAVVLTLTLAPLRLRPNHLSINKQSANPPLDSFSAMVIQTNDGEDGHYCSHHILAVIWFCN